MSGRRIDTVLRVRALHERLARAEVARHRAELDERRRLEAEAWGRLEDRSSPTVLGAPQLQAHHRMLGTGVSEARTAGARVGDALQDVDRAVGSWQQEAQRLDGIERLAERIATEAAEERDRLEANELDDLVVMRWGSDDHDRTVTR